MSVQMAIAASGAGGNPALFPPAADLSKPWNAVFEDGTKAVITPAADGRFDLTEYRKHGDRATLTTEFEAPYGGIMLMGCGADWYSEIELNGCIVFSTLKSGNTYYPAAASNYVFPVAVRAGRNQLTLRSQSGDTYWIQYIKFFAPDAEGLKSVSRQALLDLLLPNSLRLDHEAWVTPEGSNAFTVNFISSHPGGAAVRYRTQGGAWQKRYELQGGRIRTDERVHHIRLTDLAPGQEYELETVLIDSANGEERAVGRAWKLRNPAADETPVTLFVFSDLHRTIAERKRLLADYLKHAGMADCRLWVSLGDFLSKTDNFEFVQFSVLDFLNAREDGVHPLVLLRGNHEFRGAEAGSFFRFFAPQGEAWGLFRYGPLCVITLDAGECDAYKPMPRSHTFLNFGEDEYFARQRAWLQAAVKSPEFQTAACRMVLCHGAPIATGPNTYMSDHLKALTDGILTGTAPSEKIDLWLAGHIHVFRRFDAGSVPGIPFPVLFTDGPDYGGRDDSAFRVAISGSQVTVEAVDRTGECFDRMTVTLPSRDR